MAPVAVASGLDGELYVTDFTLIKRLSADTKSTTLLYKFRYATGETTVITNYFVSV